MTEIWTIGASLDWTRSYLEQKGDERPRLSAELLLAKATDLERIHLYTNFDRPLSDQERSWLRDAVKRRAGGEPIQYITGEAPFRHLVLQVGPGVLIPRPETEVLVDEVIACIPKRVLEIGTGSAAIALSLVTEVDDVEVWATELSSQALMWAQRNLDALSGDSSNGGSITYDGDTDGAYGVVQRVHLLHGDLTTPVPSELAGTFDVIVSNPPYIPSGTKDQLPREVVDFEPHEALFAGEDGLDIFSRILKESQTLLAPNGYLLCELDENFIDSARRKSVEWYEDVHVVKDLAGRDRILKARLPKQ